MPEVAVMRVAHADSIWGASPGFRDALGFRDVSGLGFRDVLGSFGFVVSGTFWAQGFSDVLGLGFRDVLGEVIGLKGFGG